MDKLKTENITLLQQLIKTHNQLMQKRLNMHGVYRGQHFVLFYLNDHPGVSSSELAQQFGISKASLGSTIARMENNGLLIREVDNNDARRHLLYITEIGKEVATKCFEQVKQVQDMLFSQFDQDDQIKANELFRKMINGLLEMESD
ncbi:MAG: MarR family winged helix-turn-helix transcriptional regulator [Erysipelotrichaceae bacterium]|nr:MarR family winged helix-turn-helix transcriptional regulator [Erysipelotrichaceae bacterium]MDD4642409.1 MarR family winged helix-turn-helix transcriptional regulator [Erysipelotrichaceae bacterium]